MKYNMHIEKLDGTVIEHPPTVMYPGQLESYAEGLAKGDPNPQVYTTIWKHTNGEHQRKHYTNACWDVDTLALEMFDAMCKAHDWYYQYSDDHRVYTAGRDAESRLIARFNGLKRRFPEATLAIWNQYSPKEMQKENG